MPKTTRLPAVAPALALPSWNPDRGHLLAGGSLWTLAQANNYASIARLYTGAETAVQNQIDYLLSDSPLIRKKRTRHHQRVVAWSPGTSVIDTVTVYAEPAGANGQVHAVLGNPRHTDSVSTVTTLTQSLNLYSATVVVTYTYRSKNYRVQANAMRASDV